MDEQNIYTNSILTFAFTSDGQIIVKKDREGKLDTLPWLFMGCREKDIKVDYEDSIWVMNNPSEYKENAMLFFAYHLRNCRKVILDGWFVGNENALLDVGKLHGKIANHQIKEMTVLDGPSFIRVNSSLYDGGTTLYGQRIINGIETRYIVLPSDEDIGKFPELEIKELDELREDFSLLSDKMILGITGEDGKIMESFVSQIKSFSKNSFIKKIVK